MNFIPLNVFSNYALLQSALTLEDYFNELKKRSINYAGISDPDFLFAYPHLEKKAQENNVKPLYGVRLLIDDLFVVFYIKNRHGYESLLQLLEHYYQKTLEITDLKKYAENLITIIPTSNIEKLSLTKADYVAFFKKWALLTSEFYIGLEVSSSFNVFELRDFASKYNYNIVAFPHILYINKKDAKTLAMITAIKEATTLDIAQTFEGDNYFLSDEELQNIYFPDEIENSLNIAQSIEFTLSQKHRLNLPSPYHEDSVKVIRELTYSALKSKGKDKDAEYLNRLEYELEIIISLGFTNYFLMVADYVAYAKSVGILVGYGRGSGPGSLVSYLLNITTVDPLVYGLLFERFLNPSRVTYPDFDIDFMDSRRGEVLDYIKHKYSTNNVSQIVTFQTNAAKASLRDAGRIFNIDNKYIDRLSSSIPTSSLTLRENYIKTPRFRSLVDNDQFNLQILKEAVKLEGFPRQTGLHAAGLIVDKDNLTSLFPTFFNNDQRISQYEMGFLESQGFLKVDILGLSNLTIIDNIIKNVAKNYGVTLDFYNLPDFDSKVYQTISSGQTLGLFQIESDGMRKAILEIKPTNFDDVCSIIALNRPGPMQYISEYARRKNGNVKINYLNKDFEQIFKPTYGIMVYQEQIMQVVRTMAGFSLGEADILRRAISKKNEDKIMEQKSAFIEGALSNGYSEDDTNKVFEDILKFANYGFNKSHSVVYTLTTLALSFLKTHYPGAFYSEILKSGLTDTKAFQNVIKEFKYFGLEMTIPNITKSELTFVEDNKKMIFPLTLIKGINTDLSTKIINERNAKQFTSLADVIFRLHKLGAGYDEFMALAESGALDVFNQNRATIKSAISKYLPLVELELFTNESALNEILVDEVNEDQLLKISEEVSRLRYPLSHNPFSYLNSNLGISLNDIEQKQMGNFTTFGLISSLRVIKTKAGENMAFATLTNYETDLNIVIFPKTFVTVKETIRTEDILIVSGFLELKDGEKQFIVSHIERYKHE